MGIIVYLRILISCILLITAMLDYTLCVGGEDSKYDQSCQNWARIGVIVMSFLVLVLEGAEIFFGTRPQTDKKM